MKATSPGKEEEPKSGEKLEGQPINPDQGQLPPSPTHFPRRGICLGGGARARSGALRQPPPPPEAAGTGWSRLEPAAPPASRRLTKGGGSRPAYPCAVPAWGVGIEPHPHPHPHPHRGLTDRGFWRLYLSRSASP